MGEMENVYPLGPCSFFCTWLLDAFVKKDKYKKVVKRSLALSVSFVILRHKPELNDFIYFPFFLHIALSILS